MLEHLSVRNLALIDSIGLDFCAGFNVLTGETGAGKSIIVDSLKLALGGKNERDLLRRGEKRGSVEAVFNIADNTAVHALLQQEMLPDDDETLVLSRELNESGRSTCRVNGVLVSASLVKQLASCLIDIYGQHDHQSLLNAASHLQFLDASDETGKIAKSVQQLGVLYRDILAMRARLRENLIDPMERERQLDILRFQRDEIDGMNLKIGEEEELSQRREKLIAAEQIAQNLNSAYACVAGGSASASDALSAASDALSDIAKFDPEYLALSQELTDLLYRVEDAGRNLRSLSYSVEYDERELTAIESRLEDIFSLKRKYGNDIPSILAFRDRADEKIEQLESGAQDAIALQSAIKEKVHAYFVLASECSAQRKRAAQSLQKRLLAQLRELGMEKTCFEVSFAPLCAETQCEENMTAKGLDAVTFLISPNPGMALKPLDKTVSGGELSRLMLAFKTVCATDEQVTSMVFDEIDSGIGGTTAWVIGKKMADIAKSKQVLCVTHLPAVASLADGHYTVGKSLEGADTRTHVTILDADTRVSEIARMLGGEAGQQAYLNHAREMLSQAAREKQ